ncbi:MAG: RNA polymerase sigma factor [Flavobacteriales bacterium]|nr:RNA polymerase sigma factor [Flavobacteriales bacterium]
MTELSDEELLALLRSEQSKQYGFNLLVRQFQRPLYRFARRMVTQHADAEDVLQNVFIKAWKGLDGFRSDARLFSWLYRITHNECLDHLRKQKRGLFRDGEGLLDSAGATWDSSEHFTGDEIQRRLQLAVMRLPDKQRAVFTMKYFESMKYEEMSAITGTSVGALKSSYHIAVRKIETWLQADQTK